MMHYLGAPVSLGFRAGEGAATLRSKDSHGPQPAGAAEKKREEDEAGQWGSSLASRPTVTFTGKRSAGVETGLERRRTCLGYCAV